MSGSIHIPGLNYQPSQYDALLAKKASHVAEQIVALGAPDPTIFASPKQHSRMRAEFRIWHPKSPTSELPFYAMFERENKYDPVKIEQFPIVSKCINDIMLPLLAHINNSLVLRKKLFQIEFLSASTGDLVITLIYHKQLDDEWFNAATQLEHVFNASIIGRARKQKIAISKDYVIETLTVNGKQYRYEQKESSFTQPNATINQMMINWVCDNINNQTQPENKIDNGDLLELYCGNGNFTIPMSKHFNKVLATEIAKSSIASAQNNCHFNSISNIDFVRLSGEETASALDGERAYRRLKHIDLDSYDFQYVFVDPPRAGIDDKTIRFIQRFPHIIYVSCNPETLASNLKSLTHTHHIDNFAIFDQFPYTPHCECAVILSKIDAN